MCVCQLSGFSIAIGISTVLIWGLGLLNTPQVKILQNKCFYIKSTTRLQSNYLVMSFPRSYCDSNICLVYRYVVILYDLLCQFVRLLKQQFFKLQLKSKGKKNHMLIMNCVYIFVMYWEIKNSFNFIKYKSFAKLMECNSMQIKTSIPASNGKYNI